MVSHKILRPIARGCSQAGFTLIEILVVVALLATISGFGLIVGMDSYRGYAFRADRDTLVSLLQRARSQSINNICIGASCTNGKPHGVFIDATSGQYILFQGAAYATRDSVVDEVTGVSPLVKHSGLTEVVFAQLSGDASSTGDIILSGTAGQVSTTSVNAVGQIAWTQ
ncbi:MAG TPA: prepilin-type N-terminal cleavage/methylation domain-containing protein [Candidatus Paceibacterota bacterium]